MERKGKGVCVLEHLFLLPPIEEHGKGSRPSLLYLYTTLGPVTAVAQGQAYGRLKWAREEQQVDPTLSDAKPREHKRPKSDHTR